jgi:hypothetical protein
MGIKLKFSAIAYSGLFKDILFWPGIRCAKTEIDMFQIQVEVSKMRLITLSAILCACLCAQTSTAGELIAETAQPWCNSEGGPIVKGPGSLGSIIEVKVSTKTRLSDDEAIFMTRSLPAYLGIVSNERSWFSRNHLFLLTITAEKGQLSQAFDGTLDEMNLLKTKIENAQVIRASSADGCRDGILEIK